MSRDRRLEVRVGAFVLAALGLAVAVVLLLGQQRHVFQARATLHCTFTEVGGLVQGAAVRLSGVNVGTVARIRFVRVGDRPLIQVDLEIAQSALDVVRADSMARISTQGLLGDKIIEISAGSYSEAQTVNDGWIKTAPAPDLDRMLAQATAVLEDARHVAERTARAVDEIADPRTIASLRQSLGHVHAILHAVEKGDGLAHALFYDRRTARSLEHIGAGVEELVARVGGAVARVDAVLATTDGEGRQVINNAARAAAEVGRAAAEIGRTAVELRATAARLNGSPLMPALERTGRDLADIVAYVKRGQGTLGAFLIDPTVYEQLVQVLGGIGRSRILRALVRYAISRDDERGVGRVVDDKNVPAVKPPPRR